MKLSREENHSLQRTETPGRASSQMTTAQVAAPVAAGAEAGVKSSRAVWIPCSVNARFTRSVTSVPKALSKRPSKT